MSVGGSGRNLRVFQFSAERSGLARVIIMDARDSLGVVCVQAALGCLAFGICSGDHAVRSVSGHEQSYPWIGGISMIPLMLAPLLAWAGPLSPATPATGAAALAPCQLYSNHSSSGQGCCSSAPGWWNGTTPSNFCDFMREDIDQGCAGNCPVGETCTGTDFKSIIIMFYQDCWDNCSNCTLGTLMTNTAVVPTGCVCVEDDPD